MDQSAVHYSSKPHTPDDELGEWTHLRVDATSSGSESDSDLLPCSDFVDGAATLGFSSFVTSMRRSPEMNGLRKNLKCEEHVAMNTLCNLVPCTSFPSTFNMHSVVSAIPPKTLNLATATTEPKPKRSVSSALVPLALFLMSLPFGFLASVMAIVLYVPVVNLWLNKNYLTVHVALGATLVFFFIHIFPRVKASFLLSVIFTTLFLCSVAYLLAVLSVIVDTPVVFMLNCVCFVVCLQLVVYSTLGLDLTSLLGLIMLGMSFTADYALVAFLVPSRIADKIIAFVSLAGISKGFQMKIFEVVAKYKQDEAV